MRALLVCHYFWPEIGAPQARWSEMVAHWFDAGVEVEVLTGFPNHPTGVVPQNYRGHRRLVEQHDGYRIVRTWLYTTPNEGIVKKTLGHLSFMISAVVQGWRAIERPDVVIVSSPTFFSILPAWIYSRRFRVPLVVEVRDLWPAVFVDLGVLTNRWVIRLLERLELAAYAAATLIVVVTDGFKTDLVRRGVPGEKVEVITNGVDLDRFQPGPADPDTRRHLGVDDPSTTLVVYIGAHGISQGLESVIDAIELVNSRVHLALIGEGAERAALLERTSDNERVTMLNGIERDAVPDVLRSADILLVPLRDVPLFSTFIPSKIFENLASGTATIGSVAGEAARILTDAGAVVVHPEDPAALAEAISTLACDGDCRTAIGVAGRRYVETHYDRSALAQRYLTLLRSILPLPSVGPASPQP